MSRPLLLVVALVVFWLTANAQAQAEKSAKPIKTFSDSSFRHWAKDATVLTANQAKSLAKNLMYLGQDYWRTGTTLWRSNTPVLIDSGTITEPVFYIDNLSDNSSRSEIYGPRSRIVSVGHSPGPIPSKLPAPWPQDLNLTFVDSRLREISEISNWSPLQVMKLVSMHRDEWPVSDLNLLGGTSVAPQTSSDTQRPEPSALGDLSALSSFSAIGTKVADAPNWPDPPMARPKGMIEWPTNSQFYSEPDTLVRFTNYGAIISNGSSRESTFEQCLTDIAALLAEKQLKAVGETLLEPGLGLCGKMMGGKADGILGIKEGLYTPPLCPTENEAQPWALTALNETQISDRKDDVDLNAKLSDRLPFADVTWTEFTSDSEPTSNLSSLRAASPTSLDDIPTFTTLQLRLKPPRLHVSNAFSKEEPATTAFPKVPIDATTWELMHVYNLSSLRVATNLAPDPVRDFELPTTFSPAPISSFQIFAGKPPTTGSNQLARASSGAVRSSVKPTGRPIGSSARPTVNPALEKPIPTFDEPAFIQWTKEVAALDADQQVVAVSKKLKELNPDFDGEVIDCSGVRLPKIENGVITEFGFATDNVTDISPVRVLMGLKGLTCGGSADGKRLLSDLSPLQGMKLTTLKCSHTQVSDLSPLKGMPLEVLFCSDSQISDLSPLEGMSLTQLKCDNTRVRNLSPLKGMKLTILHFEETLVSELSPLEEMKLHDVGITPGNINVWWMRWLRGVETIKTFGVGYQGHEKIPAEEFWKKYNAGYFGRGRSSGGANFILWGEDTPQPALEKQMWVLMNKLQDLNPHFDGTGLLSNDEAVFTKFEICSDDVTNISPVRTLVGLKDLACPGKAGKSNLSDLSPLTGMALTNLNCQNTKVSDLSPLAGMPLTTLNCHNTSVVDLSPLAAMPTLTSLNVTLTNVTPASVAALQKALPKCTIRWNGSADAKTPEPESPAAK